MIKKVLLLVRTVRHLKPIQVVYQVYNRVKTNHNLAWFANRKQTAPDYRPLTFSLQYDVEGIISDKNSFTFLNISHRFDTEVNWDYQGYGKLWNYNLQYFNFLHQRDVPVKIKQHLLKDIGEWLTAGKLKLEPYPVALRVINTIRFLAKEKLNDDTIQRDLYAQLAYLNQNIEYHLLGNHLLEDAFALTMGGYVFNNHGWMKKGASILQQQLQEQVLNDGGHFELSPMYHQIILFRVLELIDWYGKLEIPDVDFLNFIKDKAAHMLGWLQSITFLNGDIPHFNDSANGITFSSVQLLSFGEELGVKPVNNLPLAGSGYRAFKHSNYECIVDVGEVGPSYQPGHSHSDALSFVLYNQGKPIIVDAGTSTYQIGAKRSYERSTNAHNTVEIGGQNQSEVWGGFRVGRRAEVKIITDKADTLTAVHNGYQKDFAANHQRCFTFAKGIITIVDKVVGGGNAACKALFHFHPDYKIQVNGDKVLVGDIVTITFTGATQLEIQPYELADGYNKYLPAICLTATFTGELKSAIAFL